MTTCLLPSRLFLWICWLSFILLPIACSKAPDAAPLLDVDFSTIATPSLNYPISIQFVNVSDSTGSCQWDFGNDRSSRDCSPTVPYDSSGSFPVRLTVTHGNISRSVTKQINVPFRRLSVAVLYVVPKERTFEPGLLTAIRQAMPVVQTWYRQQLDGRTFSLNTPAVDTIHSSRYGYEYGTTSIDLLSGISDEVYRKTATKINPNEQVILLFYPVGIPGAVGVGVANRQNGTDRRVGIIGSDACQRLLATTPAEQNLGLWTTAHELGHALGLSHNLNPTALMFGPVDDSGYLPDAPRPVLSTCQLTPNDKVILRTSLFLRY